MGNLGPVIRALTQAFQLLSKVLPGTGRPPWGRLLPRATLLEKALPISSHTHTQTKRATLFCERLQHPEAAPNEPTFLATQKAL